MAVWPVKRVPRPRHAVHVARARVPNVYPVKRARAAGEPLRAAVGDLKALLTTAGRVLNARSMAEGVAFRVVSFAVGTGGYYPREPTKATPIDVGATGLEAEVFRKAPVAFEQPIPEAMAVYCRIDKLEAPYGLGELAIFVEILDSPVPADIGDVVCYALVHFPINAHNSSQVLAWRVSITW